jgi:hypothetical protein
MSFWDIVWFIFIFFAFMAYLMVLFTIITDLFRDDTVSGWMKALWIILLIFFPLITALIYVIVRGKGMQRRQVADAETLKEKQESYIRTLASTPMSPADHIARAKELLDSGTISQEEFDQLKAKALAS